MEVFTNYMRGIIVIMYIDPEHKQNNESKPKSKQEL